MNKTDACKELIKLLPAAYSICRSDDLKEDLLSEAILVFLESDQEFKDIEHCKNFVVVTMNRLFTQYNNEFHKKYASYLHTHDQAIVRENLNPWQVMNEDGKSSSKIYHDIIDSKEAVSGKREYANEHLLAVAMDHLHWYNRELINLYAEVKSYRKISQMTGINHVEVFNAIRKGRDQIHQYLNVHA